MQYLDKVEVLRDREEYKKFDVHKGMIGDIISGEIRDNCFEVIFIDERCKDKEFLKNDENFELLKDDIVCSVKIEDLKLIEERHASDEWILAELPLNDPKWWCKVENGFIINLLGEHKNKIPYDYNS